MKIQDIDLFKIVEISRNSQTKRVIINLKIQGFWEVRLCNIKGEIDFSFPQLYLTEAKHYHLHLAENRRYYFLFVSAEIKFILSETVLPLKGASNFRDLGGIQVTSDAIIKWGKIYRSDQLSQLTEDDLVYLDSIRIRSILDYRSRHEVRKFTDKTLDSAQFRYSIPIAAGAVRSSANPSNSNVETLALQMQMMYRDYIKDSDCLNSFRLMFKILQYDLSTPVLLHCSAGKDRTGIAVALIMYALGVPEKEIVANYMESANHVPQRYIDIVDKYPRMEPIFTVDRSYLESSLDEIKALYGSIDFFLTKVLMVNTSLLKDIYLTSKFVE